MRPLPSSDSAAALVAGDPGALPTAFGHMVGRGVLLAAGMLLLTDLPRPTVVKAATAGTLAIEVFALAWFAWQQHAPKAQYVSY